MVSERIECESTGKIVTITPSSARRIRVTPASAEGEVYIKGKLVKIGYDDFFTVSRYQTIPVKRQKYKINSIEKIMSPEGACLGYYLNTATLNKSSMFLFPFLGKIREYWNWDFDFMNCFIGTEEEKEPDYLYLWYKYIPTVKMEEFEAKIKEHPEYVSCIDVDQYHVIYKFSVPKKFLDDYRLILEGKYSYISEEAKEQILNFHSSVKSSPLGKILHRDPSRREKMEQDLKVKIPQTLDLHDPLYEEDEIYYNTYKIDKASI